MSGDVLGPETWPHSENVCFLRRSFLVRTMSNIAFKTVSDGVLKMQRGRISVRVMSILWYYDVLAFEYCNTTPILWKLFFISHLLGAISWTLFLFDLLDADILDIVFVLDLLGTISWTTCVWFVWGPYAEYCFWDFVGAHILNIVLVFDIVGPISWTLLWFRLSWDPYLEHCFWFYFSGGHILNMCLFELKATLKQHLSGIETTLKQYWSEIEAILRQS